MVRWPTGRNVFDCVGNKTAAFLGYAVNGSAFVYGDLLVVKEQVFAFNVSILKYIHQVTQQVAH